MSKSLRAWMFRDGGEIPALLFSILLIVSIGLIFSLFNLWSFLLLLFGIVIYVQLSQAQYMGSSVHVTEHQFEDIYAMFIKAQIKLEMGNARLFISQDPSLNAYALGIFRCTVVLTSALVEALSPEELQFVVAHELGHFKANHTVISSLLIPMGQNNLLSDLIFGFWQRKSELTADNCGVIATMDVDTAISALMKLAVGKQLSSTLNIDAYIDQIKNANGGIVTFSQVLSSHPHITTRITNVVRFWKNNFKESNYVLQ